MSKTDANSAMSLFQPIPLYRSTKFGKLSPKQRETMHREVTILKLLVAKRNPMSVYAIHKSLDRREVNVEDIEDELGIPSQRLQYSQVLRAVRNLESDGLVSHDSGTRKSDLTYITPPGLMMLIMFGYATDEELEAFLVEQSKTMSATLKVVRSSGSDETLTKKLLGEMGKLFAVTSFTSMAMGESMPTAFSPPWLEQMAVVHLANEVLRGRIPLERAASKLRKLPVGERRAWRDTATNLISSLRESMKTYEVIEKLLSGIGRSTNGH